MDQNYYLPAELDSFDGMEVHGVKFEGDAVYEDWDTPEAYGVYRTHGGHMLEWLADFDSKPVAIGYANAYAKAYEIYSTIVR